MYFQYPLPELMGTVKVKVKTLLRLKTRILNCLLRNYKILS